SFRTPTDGNIPTFQVGDIFTAKLRNDKNSTALPSEYKIGSLIILELRDKAFTFVKRLIGKSGDNILISNGVVYVNSKRLDEPYVLPHNKIKAESKNFGPVTVPAGYVFVLADNRDNSPDSRNYGFISVENVRGKALYII